MGDEWDMNAMLGSVCASLEAEGEITTQRWRQLIVEKINLILHSSLTEYESMLQSAAESPSNIQAPTSASADIARRMRDMLKQLPETMKSLKNQVTEEDLRTDWRKLGVINLVLGKLVLEHHIHSKRMVRSPNITLSICIEILIWGARAFGCWTEPFSCSRAFLESTRVLQVLPLVPVDGTPIKATRVLAARVMSRGISDPCEDWEVVRKLRGKHVVRA
jgi:hypothetical protein